MNNKVTVKAYEGQVVVPSKNNPEYGSIRVEQTVLSMNASGFMTPKKRTAFINGLVSDLSATGWVDGQSVEGHIIIKEQLEPFNTEKPDADLKVAGETGVPCTLEGQPIYRRSFFSFAAGADTLINHDNGAEIKAAQAKLAETASIEQG